MSTSTSHSAASECSFIYLPHDEESVHKFVAAYKEYRLLSLKTAPEAFYSTYETENAFDDKTWKSRLMNKAANHFAAVQTSGRILCMTTLLGPLSYGPDELNPQVNPWSAIPSDASTDEDHKPLHFRLNAIFTLPEARGKGIAQTLIRRALTFARDYASDAEKAYRASIVVGKHNGAAMALYRKSGFVEIKEIEVPNREHGQGMVVLLEYKQDHRRSAR